MFATGVPPHLVLANSIVGMQRELDVLRTDVITKLDNLPEALKQCMLQNFNVDGTIPITHVQVVDMLSELKTSCYCDSRRPAIKFNSASAIPDANRRSDNISGG